MRLDLLTLLSAAALGAVAACVVPPQPGYAAYGATGVASAPVDPHADSGVRINGRAFTHGQLGALGAQPGQIPAGSYWYDPTSGLWGMVGTGARGVIAAGVTQLGTLPPGVSGSGTTGVFINGREIALDEAAYLQQLLGQAVPPGRYFLDAQGNAGVEGGVATVNLYQRAQQQRRQASYMGSSGTHGSSGGFYDPSTGDHYFTFRDASGNSYSSGT